jgi:hypothetical protein
MADTSTIPPDDPLQLTVADPDGPGVRSSAIRTASWCPAPTRPDATV